MLRAIILTVSLKSENNDTLFLQNRIFFKNPHRMKITATIFWIEKMIIFAMKLMPKGIVLKR